MIRLLWSAGVALIVPVLFWLGGYNFDRRGDGAVGCLMGYIIVMLCVASYPLLYPGEKK